jgi:hypothetical protein
MQVNFLLLHRAPEPFDNYIIQHSPMPIHADTDLFRFQDRDPVPTGKLHPLIGIENLWAPLKAVACYGILRADTQEVVVRFIDGRPVTPVTAAFRSWIGELLKADGKKAVLRVWDNASWHVSKEVRSWVHAHNRPAKREGGVRILVCQLLVKSPWLNRIEPKWVHAKRAVAEPDRLCPSGEHA